MDFTNEKNKYEKIFSGYTVEALQRLGYPYRNIKNIILKIKDVMESINDEEAIDIITYFLDESKKRVVFAGIKIPTEFNMVKIRDLINKYEFPEKESRHIIQRLCNALEKKQIVYVIDLYKRPEKEIKNIKSIGDVSYDYFIRFLKKVSQ